MSTGLIFNIQRYSLQDGPGIRTTVFFKGCPLDCWWCHNPESQKSEPQIMVTESRCIRCGQCRSACAQDLEGECLRCGMCVDACPSGARRMVGQRVTIHEVMAEVRRDRVFFDDSGGGVTFSGGEPLLQFEFLCDLLAICRHEAIRTALDTCGHAPLERLLSAAALADLVLYDLKCMDDTRHIQYTGVSNVRILQNLQALGQHHANIWIRIPVIPGINDAEADMTATARFIATIGGIKRVSLLPYHKTGIAKSQRLGRPNRLPDADSLAPERTEQLTEPFRALDLPVVIGG